MERQQALVPILTASLQFLRANPQAFIRQYRRRYRPLAYPVMLPRTPGVSVGDHSFADYLRIRSAVLLVDESEHPADHCRCRRRHLN